MYILSFFTDDGSPKTGLAPTIKIRDVSDGSLLVNGFSMPEVGDGFYRYDYSSYDSEKDYAIVCDGGISLSDADRYVYAGNESYVDDVTNGVWSEDLSTYDSGAALIQQEQLFAGDVIIDTVSGTVGTAFPIGTRGMPSNNLTDALTICANNNIGRLRLRSNLTIEATHDISNKSFESRGIMGTDLTFTSGCSTDGATFRYLNLEGELNSNDTLLIENCSIYNLENFTGIMQGVSFAQGSECSIGSWAEIYNCRAGGEPGNEPEISIGDSILNVQQYRGNLKLTNKTADNRTVVGCLPANIIIDSTCVTGKIQLLGIGELEQDNSGAECQVDVDALLTNDNIADHVLDELVSGHLNTGSLGYVINETNEDLKRVLGLLDENSSLDQQVYNTDHRLTSARKRIYSVKASVGTDNDVLATYNITATWASQELTSYKMVRL